MDPNLKRFSLQFRNSMKKFESNHAKLDILNIAEYIPCYLNRQIILILSSLGIADSVFSYFQDLMLKNLTGMLIDTKLAVEAISNYFHGVFSYVKSPSRFNYLHEPFFRDLLKTIYRKQLQDLIYKSRIKIENGRILMGTLDETATLKENEVID